MIQAEPQLKKKTLCVLYIEDNTSDFLLIQRLFTQLKKEDLEEEHFDLERVDRISKALERVAQGGVDVVLTDLLLPDACGLEAVAKLHSHIPMMPIIALTSVYAKILGLEAIKKGAQDYMLKEELTGRTIKQSILCAIERKKLEKMKDEFVSTVSHELLTPLTIMKGGLDNLNMGAAGPLTEKQKEILVSVTQNIDRLARVIKDVLDISRLEFGYSKINLRKMNLKPLIHDILAGFYKQAEEKGIIIEKNIPDLPDVFIDPNLLMQVMNNLLNNACRHARTKIKVEVIVKMADHAVYVHIIDDGPGISLEDQKRLFNKFVQINRPEGGQGYKGTGLGLAICKEIIERLKGNIWVESSIGEGAQFCFTIPLV